MDYVDTNHFDIKIVQPNNVTFDIVENIFIILIELASWLFTFYICNLMFIKLLQSRQYFIPQINAEFY